MIHETAIISKEAEIDPSVVVGPYSIIRGKVKIGAGTVLANNVTIGCDAGVTIIGERNRIESGAVIGGPPQDLKYNDEETRVEIGDENHIREFVTINLGTVTGTGVTKVGNNCLLMAYSHIAHDCELHNHVIIANSCQLAGHVTIEDRVAVGGMCAISQFCRLGKHSYIGGFSAINKDIPPFAIAQGNYAVVRAANKIGMDRAGIGKSSIEAVHKSIRTLIKGEGTVGEALEKIKSEYEMTDELQHFVQFIENSERGIAK